MAEASVIVTFVEAFDTGDVLPFVPNDTVGGVTSQVCDFTLPHPVLVHTTFVVPHNGHVPV